MNAFICYGLCFIYLHIESIADILEQTMCFHLGMTEAFVWDHGSDQEKTTDRNETADILKEIHTEIMKNKSLIYRHKVSVKWLLLPAC